MRKALELQRLNETLEQQVAERTCRLRRATSGLLLAEEHERRELAEEIHDSLGQELALARIKLAALEQALETGDTDEARKEAKSIASLIEQADRSCRLLVGQLHSRVLRDVGLVRTIKGLAAQLHEMHGLQVETRGAEEPLELPDEAVRVMLYRAVRELLLNVVRHADSNEATVRITRCDDRLRVTVRDAGVGFEPSAATQGTGLLATRERIEGFGGTMRIESRPGEGTTVILEVPL